MGQSVRSRSSPSEPLLALGSRLAELAPAFGDLVPRVIAAMPDSDEAIVRRYLLLYTLPVLEIGQLLDGPLADALEWATIQTRLGLHLRHLDDVLDGDCTKEALPNTSFIANAILDDVKRSLTDRELSWDRQQDDVHAQLLAFETENHAGFIHDFDSLWRRVSPLCVLTETHLRPTGQRQRLVFSYREYLAWSLLHADCDDALSDVRDGSPTPVTRLLEGVLSGVHSDWNSGAAVIASLKTFLEQKREQLRRDVVSCPLWLTVISYLDEAFSHADIDDGFFSY